MSNDSKLALVLGILVVMFMGIVFSRRDVPATASAPGPAPANIEAPKSATFGARS